MNQTFHLTYKLPRQKSTGILSIPSQTASAVQFLSTMSVFLLMGNFLFQGVMNTILSSVSSLGVIFHMFLISLDYPVELMEFFGLIFPLITFDALPVGPLYEKIFKFEKINDQVLSDQFDNAGYSSIFIVKNIGSLFLISTVEIFISLSLWVTRRFKLLGAQNLQSKVDSIAERTLWNSLIDFYASNYLVFTVTAFIES
jgi:hypothetical protein